jgi:hypothetical protein
MPVVLYGCETWSLTSREENRLIVFENRVLMRIFAAKTDEVTAAWRKLHNESLRTCTFCTVKLGRPDRGWWDGQDT